MDSLEVIVEKSAFDKLKEYGKGDVEKAGYLLGNYFESSKEYLIINDIEMIQEGSRYEATIFRGSADYIIDKYKNSNYYIVGFWHTHTDAPVITSNNDFNVYQRDFNDYVLVVPSLPIKKFSNVLNVSNMDNSEIILSKSYKMIFAYVITNKYGDFSLSLYYDITDNLSEYKFDKSKFIENINFEVKDFRTFGGRYNEVKRNFRKIVPLWKK